MSVIAVTHRQFYLLLHTSDVLAVKETAIRIMDEGHIAETTNQNYPYCVVCRYSGGMTAGSRDLSVMNRELGGKRCFDMELKLPNG